MLQGIPQAILEYKKSNNFELVDKVQREIIKLYQSDFYKLDKIGKISALYDVIPNDYKNTILEQLFELINSKTVIPSYRINDPNVGLSGTYNLKDFRLYCSDVGLLTALMFKNAQNAKNKGYQKILNDKLPANLGFIYKNVIA